MLFEFISSVSEVSSHCLPVLVCQLLKLVELVCMAVWEVVLLATDRNILAIFVSCSL